MLLESPAQATRVQTHQLFFKVLHGLPLNVKFKRTVGRNLVRVRGKEKCLRQDWERRGKMSRVRRQRRLFRTAGGAEKAAIASVLGGGKGERREMGRGSKGALQDHFNLSITV